MCLAAPAKIVEIDGFNATVDFGGTRRSAVVSFIENPQIGDYVLVHAGFAIRRWSAEDVREYYEMTGLKNPEDNGDDAD